MIAISIRLTSINCSNPFVFWMIQKQIIEKKNSVQLFVLFGLILKIRSVFISEGGKGWIPFLLINIWYWWLVFMNKNLKDLSLNSNTCLQSILGRCSITNLCMFIEIKLITMIWLNSWLFSAIFFSLYLIFSLTRFMGAHRSNNIFDIIPVISRIKCTS